MRRRAYALAILLFIPAGAFVFALAGAAIGCTGMLKAAFDLWASDDAS